MQKVTRAKEVRKRMKTKMLVDLWPGGSLTNGAIGAYKEADEKKAISIDEVVWYRSSNTAMVSYQTDLTEDCVHDLLRNMAAKYASLELHRILEGGTA